MDIKVSIIVPCYKVERQLDRCVGSLVAQTLRDIEIILVDDGSPDNTPQMCDEWAANDKRIRVIHKSNQGIGFARNDGLEIAQGKYVAFVDSDDYIDKDAYRFSYTEAEKQNADAVYFWACRQYPNGKTTNPTLKKYKHWMGGENQRIHIGHYSLCSSYQT